MSPSVLVTFRLPVFVMLPSVRPPLPSTNVMSCQLPLLAFTNDTAPPKSLVATFRSATCAVPVSAVNVDVPFTTSAPLNWVTPPAAAEPCVVTCRLPPTLVLPNATLPALLRARLPPLLRLIQLRLPVLCVMLRCALVPEVLRLPAVCVKVCATVTVPVLLMAPADWDKPAKLTPLLPTFSVPAEKFSEAPLPCKPVMDTASSSTA